VDRELEKQRNICKSAILDGKAGEYKIAIRFYILDGEIDLTLNLNIKINDLISAKKVAKYSLEHNWIMIALLCSR